MGSATMRLLIDGQCLQTDSLQRGIGRYGLRLVLALATRSEVQEVVLFGNCITSSKWNAHLSTYLLQESSPKIQFAAFESPSRTMVQFKRGRRRAEDWREKAILELTPDAVVVLSAFQRNRETVLSTRRLTRGIPTLGVLHDLIPLQFPDAFLYTRSLRARYDERLRVLRDCDALLANSQATAISWRELIGPTPPVAVIGGAGDHMETTPGLPLGQRRGVLCVGAESPNKNLTVLLDAFARLPESLQARHRLTITGIRRKGFARHLRDVFSGPPEHLTIPGFVSDDDLRYLFASSRALVMPSLVEGLGLPVLEALTHGTPCIVSQGTSMTEFSRNDALAFPGGDPLELSRILDHVLTDDNAWGAYHLQALDDSHRHRWDEVANRVVEVVSALS